MMSLVFTSMMLKGRQQEMLVELKVLMCKESSMSTVAALSYGMNNKEGLIAVFDLGVGTFDVPS